MASYTFIFFVLLDRVVDERFGRSTNAFTSFRCACRTPPKRTPQAIRSYQTVEADPPKGFALIGGLAVEARQITEQHGDAWRAEGHELRRIGKPRWVNPKSGRSITPHGPRATFRTWGEDAGFPRDLLEESLGHQIGTAVERAYRRTDSFDRRRGIMQAWADFYSGKPVSNRGARSASRRGHDELTSLRTPWPALRTKHERDSLHALTEY